MYKFTFIQVICISRIVYECFMQILAASKRHKWSSYIIFSELNQIFFIYIYFLFLLLHSFRWKIVHKKFYKSILHVGRWMKNHVSDDWKEISHQWRWFKYFNHSIDFCQYTRDIASTKHTHSNKQAKSLN